MKYQISPVSRAVALVFAGLLASTPIWAKGGHGGDDGGNHGQKHEKHEKDDDRGERGHKIKKHERESRSEHRRDRDDRTVNRHVAVAPHAAAVHSNRSTRFTPEHHTHVNRYYDEQFRAGHCPPGLAKKHNGCMPPGQAKKHHWVTGQRLPAGVVTHPVPQPLLTQLGSPPAGYRYVRVGNDIVLLSPGTARVVDVIRNFGRG